MDKGITHKFSYLVIWKVLLYIIENSYIRTKLINLILVLTPYV